jgi:hypothetical protein
VAWTSRSYNFCDNSLDDTPSNVTNGDKIEGCFFNQTPAKKIGSEVRVSSSKTFDMYKTFADSGPSYPLEVSSSISTHTKDCVSSRFFE